MTWRELLWMGQGRVEHLDRLMWNHTSALLAKIHNVHLAKGKGVKPCELNPYTARQTDRIRICKENAPILRAIWGKKNA